MTRLLNTRKRLFKAQRIENAGAVRADVDAGADLLKFSGLLEDIDFETALQQCECDRESAYTPADDDDLGQVAFQLPVHLEYDLASIDAVMHVWWNEPLGKRRGMG